MDMTTAESCRQRPAEVSRATSRDGRGARSRPRIPMTARSSVHHRQRIIGLDVVLKPSPDVVLLSARAPGSLGNRCPPTSNSGQIERPVSSAVAAADMRTTRSGADLAGYASAVAPVDVRLGRSRRVVCSRDGTKCRRTVAAAGLDERKDLELRSLSPERTVGKAARDESSTRSAVSSGQRTLVAGTAARTFAGIYPARASIAGTIGF